MSFVRSIFFIFSIEIFVAILVVFVEVVCIHIYKQPLL